MATLTKGELLEIAYAATEPAVSIFMPTHHAGAAEIRQDPIRLNNLLNEAETRLTGRGFGRSWAGSSLLLSMAAPRSMLTSWLGRSRRAHDHGRRPSPGMT